MTRDFNRPVSAWAEDPSVQADLPDIETLRTIALDLVEAHADMVWADQKKSQSGHEIRYGNKGARVVNRQTGLWFDHEAVQGGDAIDLAIELQGGSAHEGFAYLREKAGGIDRAPLPYWHNHSRPKQAAPAKAETKVQNVQVDASNFLPLAHEAAEPARKYLASRGITGAPSDIMFCPKRKALAGLYRLHEGDNRITGVQYVYLDENGDRITPAGLEGPKQSNGSMIGTACRLPGSGNPVLTEGMETGLSIWQVTGRDVWCLAGYSQGTPVGLFKAASEGVGATGTVTLGKDKDALQRNEKGELKASGKGWEKIELQIARARLNFENRIPTEHPNPKADWNNVLKDRGPDVLRSWFDGVTPVEIPLHGAGDLLGAALEDRDFILNGLICRGMVSVLAAAPGVGKTTLIMLMAAAVGSGQAIGRLNPEGLPRKVLIYLCEQDLMEVRRRWRATLKALDLGPYHESLISENVAFMLAEDYEMSLAAMDGQTVVRNDEALQSLISAVRKHKADCVILDPLVEIHDASENDGTAMKAVVGNMLRRELAIGLDIGVLIAHHTSQAGSSDHRAGDQTAVRGHTAIMGAASIGFTLNNIEKDKAEELRIPSGQEHEVIMLTMAKSNPGMIFGQDPMLFRRTGVDLGLKHSVGALVPLKEKERTEKKEPVALRPRDWTEDEALRVVKCLEDKMKSSGSRSVSLLNAAQIVIDADIGELSDCLKRSKQDALRHRNGYFAVNITSWIKHLEDQGVSPVQTVFKGSSLMIGLKSLK